MDVHGNDEPNGSRMRREPPGDRRGEGNRPGGPRRGPTGPAMGGRQFRETGRDLVVLTLEGQQWQVAWRTLIPLSKDVRERSITV